VERGQDDDFAGLAASALSWWAEAGVDVLVQEAPRDWLKAPLANEPPARPERSRGAPAEAERVRRPSTSLGTSAAAGLEPLPDQLALFQDWLRASDKLPFATPTAPRVCPSGDPASGLMIMTGMPSSEDCAAGTMVSGAAGRLFDRMLAAIGRSRETVYLAGLSCLRPPAGRLDAANAGRCAEVALHHVGLVGPKAVLLMGDACSRALLGLGATQARGKVHMIETPAGPVNAIVTLSPDYLLAQPSSKAFAWADLQLLMEALK